MTWTNHGMCLHVSPVLRMLNSGCKECMRHFRFNINVSCQWRQKCGKNQPSRSKHYFTSIKSERSGWSIYILYFNMIRYKCSCKHTIYRNSQHSAKTSPVFPSLLALLLCKGSIDWFVIKAWIDHKSPCCPFLTSQSDRPPFSSSSSVGFDRWEVQRYKKS